uniref:Cytochrome c oxidase subunit 2 n=1 Tax=Ornebius fuscicerci TaxID=2153492 RepID=A0A385I212_9ORTH|nr:cytochrome c oxidase subunit II [Ornebius fuscicerci]AXY63939.1 cytochrome c oxidase subunit 2 [Ornebius fuscicerci]
MSTWSNLNFQNGSSPLMEQLTFFHDHSIVILIIISVSVLHLMTSLSYNSWIHRSLLEDQSLESIWTVMPGIVLIFIALPSLVILYLTDESFNPLITIKSIGHQWYWSYELMDSNSSIEIDSYMIPSETNNTFRLLDVDNQIKLPIKTQIRLLTTAADVIHSWTIPSLGIKIDSTPGRLNQGSFSINRPGILFGQCSEICGANHSFMPITIQATNLHDFCNWIKSCL